MKKYKLSLTRMTLRKTFFGLIWLILIIYGMGFAIYNPQSLSGNTFQSDLDLIIKMSVLDWDGVNPLLIAMFYIMGIFPLVYGAFILFDSSEQGISPYPFFVGSFGLGAFALLPYFALRQPDTYKAKQEGILQSILDSRLTAIACSLSIISLLLWGAVRGNWTDFIAQWHSSQFVHIMSLDFGVLTLLLPIAVLKDDLVRRGVKETKYFWLISSFSLLGVLGYWCLRPQLVRGVKNVS